MHLSTESHRSSRCELIIVETHGMSCWSPCRPGLLPWCLMCMTSTLPARAWKTIARRTRETLMHPCYYCIDCRKANCFDSCPKRPQLNPPFSRLAFSLYVNCHLKKFIPSVSGHSCHVLQICL